MRVKVSITKDTQFQGRTEEFSNVYTYEDVANTENDLNQLVDRVVIGERRVHGNNVRFLRAQVWDVGLAPNLMRFTKSLTGTGDLPASGSYYKECAILVKWPLARRAGLRRTIHRSLRKWIHACANVNNFDLSGLNPVGAIADGTPLDNYIDEITQPLPGIRLVAPNGDLPTGPAVVHPYLEHRQFPKGRKERTS